MIFYFLFQQILPKNLQSTMINNQMYNNLMENLFYWQCKRPKQNRKHYMIRRLMIGKYSWTRSPMLFDWELYLVISMISIYKEKNLWDMEPIPDSKSKFHRSRSNCFLAISMQFHFNDYYSIFWYCYCFTNTKSEKLLLTDMLLWNRKVSLIVT